MRSLSLGLAIFAAALAGPALGADQTEQIEDSEMPGSEIEIDVQGGKADAHRKSGAPVLELGGEGGSALPDPAFPSAGDPIDNELPGEGPEDLSGPDDDDPLPE
jgi:hypothetical protein